MPVAVGLAVELVQAAREVEPGLAVVRVGQARVPGLGGRVSAHRRELPARGLADGGHPAGSLHREVIIAAGGWGLSSGLQCWSLPPGAPVFCLIIWGHAQQVLRADSDQRSLRVGCGGPCGIMGIGSGPASGKTSPFPAVLRPHRSPCWPCRKPRTAQLKLLRVMGAREWGHLLDLGGYRTGLHWEMWTERLELQAGSRRGNVGCSEPLGAILGAAGGRAQLPLDSGAQRPSGHQQEPSRRPRLGAAPSCCSWRGLTPSLPAPCAGR